MKHLLTFSFFLFCSISNAQHFKVNDIVAKDRNGDMCVFPVISGKNKKAAQKINTFLQWAILSKIGVNSDSVPFSNVFPVENEYWGGSLYAYHVNNNDSKFFSVTISYDYTGAYTERFEQYYTFISATGEHVLLDDFFAETPLNSLGDIVNQRFAKTVETFMSTIDTLSEDGNDFFAETPLNSLGDIVNQRFAKTVETFMSTIDTLSEDGNEQYMMYAACLNYMKESTEIYNANFYLQSNNFTFVKERCSSHMMAYYDELWILNEEMSFELLSNFFNQNGSDIYNGGKWDSKRCSINDKLLNGSINKKYAITAKFEYNQFDNYLEGVYWYDKYKIPIYLAGELKEDGTFVLTATKDEMVTETFTGGIQNGVFSGTWTNEDKSLTFPFSISIN